jgi:hypothetical protein
MSDDRILEGGYFIEHALNTSGPELNNLCRPLADLEQRGGPPLGESSPQRYPLHK